MLRRHLYPDNWEHISLFVRGQANWKCQCCNKQCRSTGEPIQAFINRVDADLESEIRKHPIRYCLTVAHLNHIPMDCRIENLIAMCAPCHLRYDAQHHANSRRVNHKKRLEAQGQLSLF
jgi:hypothetical protein